MEKKVFQTSIEQHYLSDQRKWLRATTFVLSITVSIIISILPTSKTTNNALAVVVLLFSLIFVLRARKNYVDFIAGVFLFYFNYSVTVAEYLSDGRFGTPMKEVKTVEVYSVLIKSLSIFMLIFVLNYKFAEEKDKSSFFTATRKFNTGFYLTYMILLLMLLFGIKRGPLISYEVRISPIYEYSRVLFLVLYRYAGESNIKKKLFTTLLIAFALQDAYYGGRVTTIQLLILYALTIYYRKLSISKILFFSAVGIVLMTLISSYRAVYSLFSVDIYGLLNSVSENAFVNDTATFAYYGSAAIVYSSRLVPFDLKLQSFIEFCASIFIGDRNFYTVGNLSAFSRRFVLHYGGSFVFSHAYFWFGFAGVIALSLSIVLLLNALSKRENLTVLRLMAILTLPRWYLYGPLVFFRNLLITSAVLVVTRLMLEVFLLRLARKRRRSKVQYVKNATFNACLV